jgi:hypothetical protein
MSVSRDPGAGKHGAPLATIVVAACYEIVAPEAEAASAA